MAATAPKTKTQNQAPARKPKAKAKSPVPEIPILTKTQGSRTKTEKLAVEGFEDLAASIRKTVLKIDSLAASLKDEKAELVSEVSALRLDAEVNGDFHKTCEVSTSDNAGPVLVIFQDKFSKVDVAHESVLRKGLGKNFDTLFSKSADVSPRADLTMDTIIDTLGDKADAFFKLFEVTEYLKPVKGFMEKRATLRPSLDQETNDFLDGVTSQVQHSPTVKVK